MSKVEATFVLKGEDEFSEVVDKAKSKMGMLQSVIGSGAVSAAMKVAGLSGGWSSVYAKMLEASYEAKRFTVQSERLSIPVEQVAKLSRYAESSGINLSTMGRGMMMLQKFAGEALEKADSRSGKLAANLGLTNDMLREIQKGGVGSFAELKNALDQTVPEAEQTAIWIEIIGQRAFELGNFLKETPAAMREAGKESSAMSKDTIEALVKGQKAYANFQQDISILAGEGAVAFGPILAIIGAILRFLLILTAALTMVIPNGVKMMFNAIQNGWMRLRSILPSWLGGISDDEKEAFIKANQKDMDAAIRGGKEGLKFMEHNALEAAKPFMPQEEKGEKEISTVFDPNDNRTISQKVQYEQALKERAAKQDELELKEAKDDYDKEIAMRKYLEKLRRDALGMEILQGRSVRMTKEYLELTDKIKEAEAQLAKQRQANYKSLAEMMRDAQKMNREYTIDMMKLSKQFTENEISDYEINSKMQELNHTVKMRNYMTNEMLAGRAKPQDVYPFMDEERKLQNNLMAMLAERAMSGYGDGSGAKGDSLQRIGGGGGYGVSAMDIPKRQLRNLEAIRAAIERIANRGGNMTGKEISTIIKDIT